MRFLSVLILVAAPHLGLANTILFSHSGDTDPATEGWTVGGSPAGVIVGPINDGGTPAWMVDDNGDGTIYTGFLTPGGYTTASTLGWTAAIDMRLVDNDGFNHSPYMRINMASTTFGISFGEEPDGDTMVNVFGSGVVFTNQGSGSSYHSYEIVYDPGTMSADLFVDGLEVFSDFTGDGAGNPSPNRGMLWGAGSGFGLQGQGNYSFAEFTVVPEPSSAMLLMVGAIFATRSLVRRKKRT